MAVSPLAIDTSAYAAFKRGRADAVACIRSHERLVVPAIVLGELFAGFALGSREQQNRDELDELLASPRVTVAAAGEATAECYAAILSALRRAGTPVPTNDLWIAATAMEHGALLLTADAHFEKITQIRVRRLAPS
jgi:tRNA(fMet)-specific endonuclease VapC